MIQQFNNPISPKRVCIAISWNADLQTEIIQSHVATTNSDLSCMFKTNILCVLNRGKKRASETINARPTVYMNDNLDIWGNNLCYLSG